MSKLPDPYASPPGRSPRYALYICRHRDDDTQCMVMTFAEAFLARKFLDVLLRDDGLVWEDCYLSEFSKPGSTIRSETGIVVSTRWYPKRMRECVDHEYSLAEIAFDLTPQYVRWAKGFRNGPEMPRTLEEDTGGARVREKRERKASAPRTSTPTGYIHVSDVALSMGIDAKQARVALRKIYGDNKPAFGWNFDPKEVDELKKKIKEAIK